MTKHDVGMISFKVDQSTMAGVFLSGADPGGGGGPGGQDPPPPF